jgi:hypothetical protein
VSRFSSPSPQPLLPSYHRSWAVVVPSKSPPCGRSSLTAIWTFATVNYFKLTIFGTPGHGFVFTNGWWETLLVACYLPCSSGAHCSSP